MPVYNNPIYIQKAVQSVTNQNYKKWELIIINDGSTDETSEICNQLALQDKRITVFHEKNKGPSSARNLGIKHSTGEYCLFIDSDDYLELNALDVLRKVLKKDKVDLILFGYNDIEISDEKSKANNVKITPYKRYFNNEQFKKDYNFYDLKYYTHPIWNKAYRKEIIEKYDIKYPTDVYNSGDFIFNLQVFERANNVCSIDEALYNYVNHKSGSITTSFKIDKIDSYEKIYIKAHRLLNEWNYSGINNLNNEYINNISSFINSLYLDDCPLTEKEKEKLADNIVNRKSVINCLKEIKSVGMRNKIVVNLINGKKANLLLLTGKIARIKRKIIT